MAFPVSPIDGATTTVNGIIYSYSATDNAWTRQLSPIANLTVTGNIVSGGNIVANSGTTSSSTTTGALVVAGGAGIGGALHIGNTGDVSANIGTVRANLNTINANLGTATTNITTLFSNAGTQATSINTINANLGTATTNITSIQANLGAYQTFANANAATQATSINTVNANIGAFYNYANTKIGTNTNSNLVVVATTTSTSTTTGALVVKGGAGIAGNVYTDKLYTTNGLFWAGNGAVISTGGGTPVTPFVSDTDLELITDSVTESFDFGLVTDLTVTTTYDLGTISADISGDSILHYSITGDKLVTGTDISVGNITAAGGSAIIPDTDNTGFIGNATNTWANGQFTNLTVDSTLSVRAAIDLADNDVLRFGSSDDWEFFHNGVGNFIDLNVGDLVIRDNTTQRASFARTSGNLVLDSTTTSSSTTTGALVVGGGIGVAGNVNIASNVSISRSLGVGTAVAGNIGEIRATNYITAFYSDKRLKSNIEPITSALSKVKQLAGVLYTQNTLAEQYGYNDYDQQVGLFAQDVQQVLPQAVKPAPFDIGPGGTSISGQNYLTIQYEKMVPLLVEAIKELSDLVDQLKEK